ncbi:MAG: hypothetical protein JST09_09530 [Bacteroidetes bacterium]|nr:hypothetical protein [Bacteroidota bacterium]
MDNSTNDSERLLLLYLDGELKGDEEEMFLQRLREEPSLKEELDHLRIARESVRLLGIKNKVGSIHREMMNELPEVPQRKPVRKLVSYTLAAAAVLFAIFIGIRTYTNSSISSGQLYTDHFFSYELSTSRGGEPISSPVEQLYRQKNYKAITTLPLSEDSLDVKSKFLTGISFMETGDFVKAGLWLKKCLTADNNSVYKDASEYYLALAGIHEKKYDEALEWLHKIQGDPRHLYHSKVSDHFIQEVERAKELKK